MEKERIIKEIQRTAKAHSGVPLGWKRFENETGIRYYDWFGKFWTKWGDAVSEAGFKPNSMSKAYDDEFLLEKLAMLTRRLRRLPTQGDLLLTAKNDSTFPSEKVFRRFGIRSQCAARVIAFCEAKPGYDDVSSLWRQVKSIKQSPKALNSLRRWRTLTPHLVLLAMFIYSSMVPGKNIRLAEQTTLYAERVR